MIRFLITLSFIIFLSLSVYCDNLYLIFGCPTPKSSEAYTTKLFVLNGRELNDVRTIWNSEIGTSFIHVYYDEKMIIVMESLWYNHRKEIYQYSIIDMQHPEKKIILYPPMNFSDSYFSILPNGEKYIGYGLASSENDDIELTWINLDNLKTGNKYLNYFDNIIVSGLPGALTDGGDWAMLKMMNFGEIYKTINSNISFKLNWTIPKDLLKYEKDTIVLFVNNNYMRVISLWNEMDVNKKEENRPLIHDKVNNRWYYESLPGSFRAFGKWIAGYVCYPNKENKVIPGKDMRKNEDEEDSEYGLSFDWRAFFKETYAPGIVYLYDVQTRRRIEMDTGQGDSEILLVDGDDVYYRVYDAIYKAKITDDGITGKTLLVKESEIVPHIHWAFIGP